MNLMMSLGRNILVGQKIKTSLGWRIVKQVTDEGVVVKEGVVKFGTPVFGWKSS